MRIGMDAIRGLISLGAELSKATDASADLWTWLPSYAVAQKHHGDHAFNFQPPMADVMEEAAMYFARLKRPDAPLTEEEREWFGECPCGEFCEQNEGGI